MDAWPAIQPWIAPGGDGLVLGVDRHGEPVAVRLFQPVPACAVLVGSAGCAQVITLRALALGARVVLDTDRPADWAAFQAVTGVGGTGHAAGTGHAVGAGYPAGAARAVSPMRPVLVVRQRGSATAAADDQLAAGGPATGWQTVLVVRDRLGPADVDLLRRADLVLLQPLTASEAEIASRGLRLATGAEWLTRIRPDMLAVAAGPRALRWAMLSRTGIEEELTGPLTR